MENCGLVYCDGLVIGSLVLRIGLISFFSHLSIGIMARSYSFAAISTSISALVLNGLKIKKSAIFIDSKILLRCCTTF